MAVTPGLWRGASASSVGPLEIQHSRHCLPHVRMQQSIDLRPPRATADRALPAAEIALRAAESAANAAETAATPKYSSARTDIPRRSAKAYCTHRRATQTSPLCCHGGNGFAPRRDAGYRVRNTKTSQSRRHIADKAGRRWPAKGDTRSWSHGANTNIGNALGAMRSARSAGAIAAATFRLTALGA